ncbi:hypothetical protein ACFL6S_08375 [Candidatus Poribacteria bacterium]
MLDSDLLKQEIIALLDREFSKVPVGQLPGCIELIENRIIENLNRNLFAFLSNTIDGVRVSRDSTTIFIDEIPFNLLIGNRDLLKSKTLGIALLCAKSEFAKSKLIRQLSSIEGFGRYSSFEIIIPPTLEQYIGGIIQIVHTILDTGYSWLREFIRRKISSLETNLADELHSYLRQIFASIPKQGLVENIWLGVVDRSRGFYILDKISTEKTIRILTKKKEETILSPAQLFAHLLTTALPFNHMHAKLAVSTGKCIDADLRTSKYLDDAPAFELAEEAVFMSRVNCVFAIVREGNQYLISAFPKNMKDDILPVLESHSQKLATIFRRNKSKARTIWKILCEKATDLSIARTGGEFIGGIFKVFLE